jgi:hypothetical protein
MTDHPTRPPTADLIAEIVERHVQRYQWGDDTLHGAIKEAAREGFALAATAEWTEAFQPGGPLYGILPTGSDVTVDGGKWLVDEVKRLRTALGQIANWPQAEMFTSLAPAVSMKAIAKDTLAVGKEVTQHG